MAYGTYGRSGPVYGERARDLEQEGLNQALSGPGGFPEPTPGLNPQPPAFDALMHQQQNQRPTLGNTPGGGFGTPESGYGQDGVNNPAFRGTTVPSGATVNPGGSGTLPDGTQVPPNTELPGGGGSTNAPGTADRDWRMGIRQRGLAANAGTSSGWNTGDYGGDVKAATSMKNTFHALAQKYPPTKEGLQQLVQDPDFKRAFPKAKIVQHPTGDKIDFGGQLSDFESGVPVGIVDVGMGFGADGSTWGWIDEANDGGGGGGGAAGGGGRGGGPSSGLQSDIPESTVPGVGASTAPYGPESDALARYLAILHSNQLFNRQENFMLR